MSQRRGAPVRLAFSYDDDGTAIVSETLLGGRYSGKIFLADGEIANFSAEVQSRATLDGGSEVVLGGSFAFSASRTGTAVSLSGTTSLELTPGHTVDVSENESDGATTGFVLTVSDGRIAESTRVLDVTAVVTRTLATVGG